MNNINNKLDTILNILNTFRGLEDNLKEFINGKFEDLNIFLDNLITGLELFLKNNIISRLNHLIDRFNLLLKHIDILKQDLIKEINGILDKINKNIDSIKSNLRNFIFAQLAEQTVDLNISFLEMLTDELALFQTTLMSGFIDVIRSQSSQIGGLISFAGLKIRYYINNLESNFNKFKYKIYLYLDTQRNKILNDLLDNWYKNNKGAVFGRRARCDWVCSV